MVPVKTIGLVSGTSFEGADTALLETDSAARARAFIAPIRHPNASCCDRRSPTEARAPGGPCQSRTAGPRDARADRRTHVPGAAHQSHPNRDHWVPWSDRAPSARFGGLRSRLATAPGWHAGSGSPEACDFRAADVAAGRQGATGLTRLPRHPIAPRLQFSTLA